MRRLRRHLEAVVSRVGQLAAAGEEFYKQNFEKSKASAGRALELLDKSSQNFPELRIEDNFIEETMTVIHVWQRAHQLLGEKASEQFPLKDVWDQHQEALGEIERRFVREYQPQ